MRVPRVWRRRRGTSADLGAVFVEAVIASAIVAMALGATYRVIADSASRDRAAQARRVALLIAQSELADVGAEIPLASGDTSGIDGDLVWRVDVSSYTQGNDDSDAGGLWEVSVVVKPRAGGANLVTLRTLRMGPKA